MTQAARFRFVHVADVHLGYRQYGLEERADDFTRAFESVVRYCRDVRPDAVILAGDLFDSKTTEPKFYAAADGGLAQLGAAGIPVVAVEGNHERWYRRDARSWLWQLSRHGRLRLLQQFDPPREGIRWTPWTAERGAGAYTDIGPVRMFGVEYLGARLRSVLPEVVGAAQATPSAGVAAGIGVLHTAVAEGAPFAPGGVTIEDLQPLRAIADYLALGHVHQRYELPAGDPWIFNPGSLEAHTILEAVDGDGLEGAGRARGLFDVTVDLARPARVRARFVDDAIARRPFLRLWLGVDAAPSFESLVANVQSRLQAVEPPAGRPPVVELLLRGRLHFERAQLDAARLLGLVEERFRPLHARLTLELRAPGEVGAPQRRASRSELEREVLRGLIDPALAPGERADAWARAAQELKQAALEGRPVEEQARLVEATLD
ncbi:MAG: DNA repair exonuclease [Actinobacteria bacterium]|nr:DNA repair exonuclease [Actinomycetota bacterium]